MTSAAKEQARILEQEQADMRRKFKAAVSRCQSAIRKVAINEYDASRAVALINRLDSRVNFFDSGREEARELISSLRASCEEARENARQLRMGFAEARSEKITRDLRAENRMRRGMLL